MNLAEYEIELTDNERAWSWAVRDDPEEGKILYASTRDGKGVYHCHIEQVGGLIEALINNLDPGTRADLYAEIATHTIS